MVCPRHFCTCKCTNDVPSCRSNSLGMGILNMFSPIVDGIENALTKVAMTFNCVLYCRPTVGLVFWGTKKDVRGSDR